MEFIDQLDVPSNEPVSNNNFPLTEGNVMDTPSTEFEAVNDKIAPVGILSRLNFICLVASVAPYIEKLESEKFVITPPADGEAPIFPNFPADKNTVSADDKSVSPLLTSNQPLNNDASIKSAEVKLNGSPEIPSLAAASVVY
jgi:hypothetical protein